MTHHELDSEEALGRIRDRLPEDASMSVDHVLLDRWTVNVSWTMAGVPVRISQTGAKLTETAEEVLALVREANRQAAHFSGEKLREEWESHGRFHYEEQQRREAERRGEQADEQP